VVDVFILAADEGLSQFNAFIAELRDMEIAPHVAQSDGNCRGCTLFTAS
jgi:hypothetical protein